MSPWRLVPGSFSARGGNLHTSELRVGIGSASAEVDAGSKQIAAKSARETAATRVLVMRLRW
jgi:hypothetical protein